MRNSPVGLAAPAAALETPPSALSSFRLRRQHRNQPRRPAGVVISQTPEQVVANVTCRLGCSSPRHPTLGTPGAPSWGRNLRRRGSCERERQGTIERSESAPVPLGVLEWSFPSGGAVSRRSRSSSLRASLELLLPSSATASSPRDLSENPCAVFKSDGSRFIAPKGGRDVRGSRAADKHTSPAQISVNPRLSKRLSNLAGASNELPLVSYTALRPPTSWTKIRVRVLWPARARDLSSSLPCATDHGSQAPPLRFAENKRQKVAADVMEVDTRAWCQRLLPSCDGIR